MHKVWLLSLFCVWWNSVHHLKVSGKPIAHSSPRGRLSKTLEVMIHTGVGNRSPLTASSCHVAPLREAGFSRSAPGLWTPLPKALLRNSQEPPGEADFMNPKSCRGSGALCSTLVKLELDGLALKSWPFYFPRWLFSLTHLT